MRIFLQPQMTAVAISPTSTHEFKGSACRSRQHTFKIGAIAQSRQRKGLRNIAGARESIAARWSRMIHLRPEVLGMSPVLFKALSKHAPPTVQSFEMSNSSF